MFSVALTEKNLAGWRRANDTQQSVAAPAKTGSTTTIATAIRKAYGNVLEKLQAKGLVTLVQSQDEAIEAAAKARSAKTGKPLAQVREALRESVRNSIAAWHGTPHRGIESVGFKLNKIGAGEGAQVYGWGAYFASKREVADHYRKRLSGVDGAENLYQKVLHDMGGDTARTKKALQQMEEMTLEQVQRFIGIRYQDGKTMIAERDKALAIANGEQSRGQLYSLTLPIQESDLLDFDKPLSEQSQKVRDAIQSLGEVNNRSGQNMLEFNPLGEALYRAISSEPEFASMALQAIGIPGLRYLDGNSRANGDGSHNYVIWDEALMTPEAAGIEPKFSADGAIQGFYDPQSGQSFLIADGMTAAAAPGVLAHEVGIHMAADAQSARGKQAMDKLVNRAGELLEQGKGAFMDGVRQRMKDAGETSNEEAAAYIAEAYERNRVNAPASVKQWVQDFIAAVRGWLFRHGVIVRDNMLTPADIAAIARANVRQMARDGQVQFGEGAVRRSDSSPTENEVLALVKQYASEKGAPTEAQMREAVRQFRDTEKAYGGKLAYDKAKAAGQTKLNYGQWVQVRTPSFKAWFGDWQALANRKFLDGSPVSTLTGDEFKSDGVPLTVKVPQWYADQGASTVEVDGIGAVRLDETAVKNSLSHGIGRDKAAAFAAVPDVLKQGKIIHREGMRGSRDGVVLHVAAPISIGGKAFIADVLVKSDSNTNRMYVHEVALKEKLQQSVFKTGADAGKPGELTGTDAGAIRSVLQNVYSVNPDAVSKVVDPDTGEPMVVYHGTGADFSAFDPAQSRDIGLHFGTQEQAERFGNTMMPVYLSLQNPLRVEDYFSRINGHGKFLEEIYYEVEMTSLEYDRLLAIAKNVQDQWVDDRDADNTATRGSRKFWKNIQRILERSGFDGLVYRNQVEGAGDSYIAFRPTQIKSAIGNIGTFDGSDDRIDHFAARPRQSTGTPTDRAVMDMAREGQPARDILRLIADTSRSRFNKQVARLLLKTGITPEVVFADADLGGGDGFKFKAKYSRADDRVTLTGEAAGQAEQIVLHELIHAATLKALDKPGLHSLQMRRLYEHVKRKGFGAGQYGMKNVGEFVAEAFTNPEFQRLLRQMDAASGRHAEIGLGWLCAHPALDSGAAAGRARCAVAGVGDWRCGDARGYGAAQEGGGG